jgi:hypothetical protein
MQYPLAPTTQSDVALLDMAAGHFAKLELATSMQVDVQFVRDIADIAHHKINESNKCIWADLDLSIPTLIQDPVPKSPEDQEVCVRDPRVRKRLADSSLDTEP